MIKSSEIKDIALNPIFCPYDMFEALVNQGIVVRWLTKDELDSKEVFLINIENK